MTPEESLPWRRPLPDGALTTIWVIYDHPKDFEHGYVLRAQWPTPAGTIVDDVAWYADQPDKLRSILPPGVVKLLPAAGDNPAILETWI